MTAAPDFSDRPIADLISLAGRCAVVTGGASGIGLSVARRLAEAGADVVIVDIDAELAAASERELIEAFGRQPLIIVADVADPATLRRVIAAALDAFGRLDIWVNNAGICHASPLAELSLTEWDLTHHLDLRAAFLGAQAAARVMTASGRGGVILNMASISAFRGRPNHVHYTAAKHGVIGLTKSLAVELGAANIRVIGIAPTLVLTEGQRRHVATSGAQANEVNDAIARTIALGRLALPDDVARVALFLASDLAGFVTGSTVLVDGGSGAF